MHSHAVDGHRVQNYQANLRYCCNYFKSVSQICRKININRQQFNRYLNGEAVPSNHNHKVISDFFGLEYDELFYDHQKFVKIFQQKLKHYISDVDRNVSSILFSVTKKDIDLTSEYSGYYFKYFYSFIGSGKIKRELVKWSKIDGNIISSTKQAYMDEDEKEIIPFKFMTYRGLVSHIGNRLVCLDFDRWQKNEVSMTFLYPKTRILRRLNGMITGITHSYGKGIVASRVAMDYLGPEVDVRWALSQLGVFDADDVRIPNNLKISGNDVTLGLGSTLFHSKF